MTKLIIFDLDGTLLNTMIDIANSCNYALNKCGFRTLEIEQYNQLVGRGIYNLLKYSIPEEHRNEEAIHKMEEHFYPHYNIHKSDMTRPYEGIMEMLKDVEKKGIRMAVASNKYQEGTEELVKKFFGKFDFVKILGQRDGFPIKPDPAIVDEIMAEINGINKDEVVYCGDSDVDMQTGLNAGVKTIGVSWGFRTIEELKTYQPFAIVNTPDEIIKAIE